MTMSEHIELEGNNLCTTEDAFEEFQSVSMCEENEFITLSDIVPPKLEAPDHSNELNEIPYDNEVVLSSNKDDRQHNVNTTINSGTKSSDCTLSKQIGDYNNENLNTNTLANVSIENIQNNGETSQHGRKRGRKKKNLCGNNEFDMRQYTEGPPESIQEIQNFILDTTLTTSDQTKGNQIKNVDKPIPKQVLPRRTARERVSNISVLPMSSDFEYFVPAKTKKVGAKRGRPKKKLENLPTTTCEADSTHTFDNIVTSVNYSVENSLSKTVMKVPTKRGRKKKIKHKDNAKPIKNILNVDSSLDASTSESQNTALISGKPKKKKTGKQGKKVIDKLNSEQIEHTSNENLESNVNYSNNDNMDDDISLSKLSKTDSSTSHTHDINHPIDATSTINNSYIESAGISSSKLSKKRKGKSGKCRKHLPEVPNEVEITANDLVLDKIVTDVRDDDDGDEILLSKLKEKLEVDDDDVENNPSNISELVERKYDTIEEMAIEDVNLKGEIIDESTKRNTKIPKMNDFEYNLDSVVTENCENKDTEQINENTSLLQEDGKRPVRRKVKKNLHYDEDTDEDPFANIELSDDDEPRRLKKGNRYYSDDEYVPDGKRGKKVTESSDSELNENFDEVKMLKRRKVFRKSDSQSPRKRGKKTNAAKMNPNVTTITAPLESQHQDDIEDCLQTSVIKANDESGTKPPVWGNTNAFENFLAKKMEGTNLKIKKVSCTEVPETKAALQIPVIDPNEPKKTYEMCSQTNIIPTTSTEVQTGCLYDIPMKETVGLSSEQSEKACEFLTSVVKTTSELGQLMTEKSEDFIKKKINTENVIDTMKMDYCVRKSFLLFKLAKHNLTQMEEDLSKQYEEFLKENKLLWCRQEPKKLAPKVKENDDSDCEIVEIPVETKKTAVTTKANFNPKTVFLNKELSIKIAKKPSEDKKLNIKGKHSVWINDSVMVKKVKPTQSFLAQDSRNKKPPDNNYITEKMVSDFFDEYYHRQISLICGQYTSREWLNINEYYVCNYFVIKPDNMTSTPSITEAEEYHVSSNLNNAEVVHTNIMPHPDTLFTLCIQALQNQHILNTNVEIHHDHTKIQCEIKTNYYQPKFLAKLCVDTINQNFINSSYDNFTSVKETFNDVWSIPVLSLKTLSLKKVADLFHVTDSSSEYFYEKDNETSNTSITENICNFLLDYVSEDEVDIFPDINVPKSQVKSLFTLCIAFIQSKQTYYQSPTNISTNEDLVRTKIYLPKTLREISFSSILPLLYKNMHSNYNKVAPISVKYESVVHGEASESFTINCVNTLTEEAFHNLEELSSDVQQNEQYLGQYEDDDSNLYNNDEFGSDFNDTELQRHNDDSNWESQVQMQELRSCFNTSCTTTQDGQHNDNTEALQAITRIKIERIDEISDNVVDSSIVKTEPLHGPDEMTIFPENIIAKSEIPDTPNISGRPVQRKDSSSYDVDTFESFVSRNKMMYALTECGNEEIYSQSALRIRRQHEPDYYDENDMNNSLLVPQTFEPLNIDNAKGCLMQSSSDDDKSSKKVSGKKKTDKRKTRPKKTDSKLNNKDTETKEKGKPIYNTEVAVLTRRMREKIRQEEKKKIFSDSDDELSLNTRKNIDNKKDNNGKIKSKNKSVDDEIQCNNVDSTQQLNEKVSKPNTPEMCCQFSGFSAVDQNEITSYQKYMKYVYDKIIPKVTSDEAKNKDNAMSITELVPNISEVIPNFGEVAENLNENSNGRSESPLINYEDPVEMLECEPTMPIFDDFNANSLKKPSQKSATNKSGQEPKNIMDQEIGKTEFVERHGWKCYPINNQDVKIYQHTYIPLYKLPESFVQTYLKYQDITDKNSDDKEVDRLTNLNTLNRVPKDGKVKCKSRNKMFIEDHKSGQISEASSRPASRANSERCDELTPSEDEGTNIDDEVPQPLPARQTENCLAKNLLMDDHDSDDGTGNRNIGPEQTEDAPVPKKRPGPKSKTIVEDRVDKQSLMLTADKVMNKELTLLHAPIVLKNEVIETIPKGPITRQKHKTRAQTMSMRDRIKTEDDSSSEEEKQWVTTKEKLLKKLEKREDAGVDDAKRAKLVSEFIERRSDAPKTRNRTRGKYVRSRKKYFERQKQLRVLSKELYGESSDVHLSKRNYQTPFKGRRNIRKVIDKKSLARSTVIANMEEFERKRTLNTRQTRLREHLGCEEDVNVLVINDEVCLEYDFEKDRPVVTVHAFFTKVMKAHQYEGVKFMWDACFESLDSMEAGHPGGGCILAHCMGLGKTLQVLALLHTVLTHPRVGMQRVLVCCPLSTVLNWVDEIHKWIGPVTNQIKVFELSKLKKTYERAYQLEDWYSGGGIFIIGYELFRSLTTLDPVIDDVRPTIVNKIRTALLDPGPDIIVCDEGHLLKNDCSVLAVAMSRVVTKRRIMLTGTPMQNNLREYYCMVNFVKPNLLGTYSEYSNRFENPIMNGQHRDSSEDDIRLMKARTHILHKVLEGCLQRQEASVLYPYLPKKHEYTVFISLTKCQWDLYKHYLNTYGNLSKQSILKDFHILQKIWSHPQVLHNFQIKSRDGNRNKLKVEKMEDDLAHEDLIISDDIKPPNTEVWWLDYLEDGKMLDTLESSNKFVAVFRILEECVELGDKILIFSTSLFCLDALEFFLKKINKWSLGQEYYRLDGSVPPEVRQKWCREFNAEINLKTKLFLISTRAGCLGLNMTAANRVIILDTSWNPAHDIQSIFRVYRFGQKKDCYIYRLVAMGTMEQKIYERSVTKQAVACRVVDEQQIDRHYNSADLTELYRFDETGVTVVGGVAVGVTDVALLRVARDPAIHAVHEHDSLLRGSSEQNLPEHERAAAWMQFQQEHAHKQMQSDLAAMEVKPNLKRIQAQENTLGKALRVETKVNTEAAKDAEYVLPTTADTKAKKGKKTTVVNCYIPIQNDEEPGTSQQPAQLSRTKGDEEAMIRKITDILIKHNFQNRQGPKEISELVQNVRRIVSSGQPFPVSNNDELTKDIAGILLKSQDMSVPALTDIMCESINKSITPGKNQVRQGRSRKAVINERKELDDPVTEVKESLENRSGSRKKRKAALAAEKHLDSIAQDSIIEVDDDDWQGDEYTRLTVPELAQNAPPVPVRPAAKTKPAPKSVKKAKKAAIESQKQLKDNSILLSDDETPEAQPQPLSKGRVKDPVPSGSESGVIPLHPSLLSNKNFIKIVAHTYLEGNPMLDEDAATLAAQYSTFKALKEYEATGKKIDSGPIYDIAVKILGIDMIKKLHKSNASTKTPASDAPAVVQLKESILALNKLATDNVNSGTVPTPDEEVVPAKPLISVKPQNRLKPIVLKSRDMCKLGVFRMPETPPAVDKTPSAGPDVVPVGLFQRSMSIPDTERYPHPSDDECILPDDDDVSVVVDEPPPTPQPTATPPPLALSSAHHRLTRRNAQPMHLNNVVAGPKPMSRPPPSLLGQPTNPKGPPVISISNGVVLPPLTEIRPKPDVHLRMTPVPPSDSPTICLDSDDDEPLDPRPSVRGPVPVSLTAAGNNLPVPIALSAAGNQQPVPIAISAAGNEQPVPIALSAIGNLHPVPVSLAPAGNQQYVPVSMAASGNRKQIPMSYKASNGPRAVPLSTPTQTVQFHPQTSQMSPNYVLLPSGKIAKLLTSQPNFNGAPSSQLDSPLPPFVAAPRQPAPAIGATSPPAAAPTPPKVPSSALAPASSTVPSSSATPAAARSKTVCKPGDILRITRTGQVEILKRLDNQDSAVNDAVSSASTVATQAVETTAKDSKPNPPQKPDGRSDDRRQGNEKKQPPRRYRSHSASSSSSSSSDSSTSWSPDEDNRGDPLSILKDVVHIQASYETPRNRTNNAKQTKIPASSKASANVSTFGKKLSAGLPSSSGTSKSSTNKPASISKTTISETLKSSYLYSDKVAQQITKTDDIIQKLNHLLDPKKFNPQDKSTSSNKSVIDLTNLNAKSTKFVPTYSRLSGDKGKSKVALEQKLEKVVNKERPSTVVGTSKNIILNGKSLLLNKKPPTVDLIGQNSVNVTNVKTIAPENWSKANTDKKRSITPAETSAPKKKKLEQLTLKDFNIDDIDDIIELE